MSKKIKYVIGIFLALCIIYLGLGLNNSLKTTEYIIDSSKVNEAVKLAVIADLHSCYYGEGASQLMDMINKGEPDAVVLVGDIIDDRMPRDHALTFLEAVSAVYDVYYVTGNHEVWTEELQEIKELVAAYGINVLVGETKVLTVGDQSIEIAGIDDIDADEYWWQYQLDQVSQGPSENYRVLLTHRPTINGVEMKDYYDNDSFDLAISGHTHGGQWRIPGLVKGVFGPEQGLFPEFTGGLYTLEHSQLLLSRGLAKESTRVFRFYNRPEILMLTIK